MIQTLVLKNPNSSAQEIHLAEEDLKTLDYLYENFNLGMNVFRTAKGGRSKLRE
jgi:colicin import membrane protein